MHAFSELDSSLIWKISAENINMGIDVIYNVCK